MIKVSSVIRRSTGDVLDDCLYRDAKRLRKPFVEDRSRDIRRVEPQVVRLVGEQAQNVNRILDLLVLPSFPSATNRVRFYRL
jgi:hypothetical protein